jgi:hypothetical protein
MSAYKCMDLRLKRVLRAYTEAQKNHRVLNDGFDVGCWLWF